MVEVSEGRFGDVVGEDEQASVSGTMGDWGKRGGWM
jgi:hypothetical protein